MLGRIHHLLWAVAGILGVTTLWADAGYLPQAGPIPLRFRVPPAQSPESFNAPLPPPAPVTTPAPIVLPLPPMPTNTPEPADVLPFKMVPSNGPPIEYNARDPVTIPGAITGPEPVVVPQMLIKYFTARSNAATNAPGGGTAVPFGFNPPAAQTPEPTPPPATKPPSPAPP